MNQGDRIRVRHGRGTVLASVQRYRPGQATLLVRKWRKSGRWSSVVRIPLSDVVDEGTR